jgi:riboflavin synthase
MFTGIIEETGYVKKFSGNAIEVDCRAVLEDTKIGDSIAIDGCCQTVVAIGANSFTARVSQETLRVTNLGKTGARVNLERAVTPCARLGGHIVSGHIDCTGRFVDKASRGEFYELTFEIPKEFAKYVVHKGSITINGISLTLANVNPPAASQHSPLTRGAMAVFKVAIIPHTYENTNLQDLQSGAAVNIETDIIGKYIENFVCARDNKITENFLAENGFI